MSLPYAARMPATTRAHTQPPPPYRYRLTKSSTTSTISLPPPPTSTSTSFKFRNQSIHLLSRLLAFLFLLISLSLILLCVIFPKPGYSLSTFTVSPTNKLFMPKTPISGIVSSSLAPGLRAPMATTSVTIPIPVVLPSTVANDNKLMASEINRLASRQKGGDGIVEALAIDHLVSAPNAGSSSAASGLGNTGVVEWFGLDGPTLRAGPLLICSRSDKAAQEVCTSSSKFAYHTTKLPLSLQKIMSRLPSRPITPILLLLTGLSILLASVILALSFYSSFSIRTSNTSSASRKLNRFKAIWARSPPLVSDPASNVSASAPRHAAAGEATATAPHISFAMILSLSISFAIIAAVNELRGVHLAWQKWDKEEAEALGMAIHLGSLSFLLPLIPVLLCLSLVSAYLPQLRLFFSSRDQSQASPDSEAQRGSSARSAAGGASIIERKDLGGLFGSIAVADSGLKLSDGSTVFAEVKQQQQPPSLSVTPASPNTPPGVRAQGQSDGSVEKLTDQAGEGLGPERPRARGENEARRVRRSWRNTLGFGVGEAI